MKDTAVHLSGSSVLVLNWRDVRNPQAGGAERYMHEIARRWVAAGVDVTWFTARPRDLPRAEDIDGIHVVRFGGPLSLYPQAALRLLRAGRRFDAVVDCQNGIPFFSPLFAGRNLPVILVMHHVHQDQFSDRFPVPAAAMARLLEGPVARRVYGSRIIAAVSPSTRFEVRRRLGFTGPVHVVPNGTIEVAEEIGPRASQPTVVVVTRLVAHKRLDFLLAQFATVLADLPKLRLEIVGDGPERGRLQGLVADLDIQSQVMFHGRLSDADRDHLLRGAWLTVSTSAAEGWGCSGIEAAAWGVPCVALRVPGNRDSVLDGRTGWLVDDPRTFDSAMLSALRLLDDERHAREIAAECQDWARRFPWDRSAELLAGVLLAQAGATARGSRAGERRQARSDIAVLATFRDQPEHDIRPLVRCTDEVVTDPRETRALLAGCDESDGVTVLRRLGVSGGTLHLAGAEQVLTGPTLPRARRWESSEVGAALA